MTTRPQKQSVCRPISPLLSQSISFFPRLRSSDTSFEVRVRLGFQSFAMYKLLVDLSQLAFYFGLAPISMAIAAFVVRKGAGSRWLSNALGCWGGARKAWVFSMSMCRNAELVVSTCFNTLVLEHVLG